MNHTPAQVLLIEDNDGDARLLQELLAEAGADRLTLIRADRLETGLTHLKHPGIDVILLDLSLPDCHGPETLARMYAAAKGIPIVVLTGMEDEELGLRLVQTGAQDYLVKGQVTSALLTRALTYAVERKRLEGELREKTRLLQSVLDSMADGVVMADETGRFQVWNPAAERIVGAGPADVGIGRWSDHYGLFLPDRVTPYPTSDLPLARAIRGESVTNVLVFLRRPDQADGLWLSVNARPLRDETGHLNGGVAVFRDITVAKRMEEALRESQEQYRLLVTKANDIIYRTDVMGRFTFVNPVAVRIMKYPEAELLGRRFIELIHPDHRTAAERFYGRQFVRKRPSTYYEFPAVAKDGSEVWIGQNVQVILEGDQVVGFQAVARDITERKRAEEARQESEERLRSIVQSSGNAIILMDAQGRVAFWNSGAEKMFGYAAEEMLGRPVDRIIPERFRDAHRRGVQRVAASGHLTMQASMFELVGLKKDGTEFPLELSLAAWTAQSRLFVTGIIRDISDRKRVEEEREKLAKDRLLLLESTGEGIYGIDRQGRCTFMNKAAASMLGYRTDEVLGKDLHELIHHSFPNGEAYPHERCYIQETLTSGKGCQVEDEVYWRKDGTSFPVEYSSFPVLEQHHITGAVVIFLDISLRKRLEQERSQRAGRLLTQQSALTGLTQSRLFQSSLLMPTLQHLTEMAARTLDVERVSIWRYTDDREAIQCIDLYTLNRDRHLSEVTVPIASCPVYFKALATSQIIAADDAHTDERTAEFSANYLSKIGISSMMDVPIYLFGRLEGVICHEHIGPVRRWTEDEQMFAIAVSNLVALAYEQGERRRAEEQLQQSQDRLRSLTARLESVREDERIRIAREIHDELGQALTGVKLELSLLRDQLPQARPALVSTLEGISALVDATIQSVRRIATELRPVVLDQLGLIPAIEWQAREFQSRTGIQCTLGIYLRSVLLSQSGSTAMFRILQEILTNVARHARASTVNITLQEQAGGLVLEVRDNGRGVTDAELSDPKSLGLVGMRERALLLGGETTLTGTLGKGTTVRVRIPLGQGQPE